MYPDNFVSAVRTVVTIVLSATLTHLSGVINVLADAGVNINENVLITTVTGGVAFLMTHFLHKAERLSGVGPVLSRVVSLWTSGSHPVFPEIDLQAAKQG